MEKTYTIKGNKTAADVAAGNDEVLETGYTLEEAKLAAISYQRDFKYAAAWIEEEGAEKSAPLDSAKFAAVVTAAKAQAAKASRWLRAIDRAAAALKSGELIVTTLRNGALVTSANGSYLANGECQCKAFVNGHKECKHRAAARLVEMYEAAPEPTAPKPAKKAPVITRSIERDVRTGQRYTVVSCDGWAI